MKKNLTLTHPNLVKEWHSTKNGNLTPDMVTFGATQKAWWQCLIFKDHEWETKIYARTDSKNPCGCPFCLGRKVALSNCLMTTHPEIAKEWHPTKNGNLTPFDVVFGSRKKYWWKCLVADDHEWEASIKNRTLNNSGCACCSGHKVVYSNCVATIYPYLLKEWHPTKNGNLTPFDIVAKNALIKIYWQCIKNSNHVWASTVNNKIKKSKFNRCPYCSGRLIDETNCLATLRPEIAKEWHPTKNGNLTPFMVGIGTTKCGKIWWQCEKGHEWNTTIPGRKKSGCPRCKESKGEKQVICVLTKLGLLFQRQKKFSSCRCKGMLVFDFIVNLSKKDVLIEYQGAQHYSPYDFGGNQSKKNIYKNWKSLQKRDRIKKKWAIQNNIPLLIIPYWDFNNIENIIVDFIKSLN